MEEFLTKIEGGVTAAKGYYATGVCAGIKKKDRKDMALVYTKTPATVAGTFTTNVVKAAPVWWDIDIVKNNETASAIVINSGIANASTGKEGDECNYKMAEAVAKELGIDPKQVLTASTGVIGRQLPMDAILGGTKLLKENLDDSLAAGTLAAEAIMTTDTQKKECAVTFEMDGKTITVGAMSKGSGMIHPNMATMLGVVTTDISISKELLQSALSSVVVDTFNMISVDRDTSTNDTLVCFANGLAGNDTITAMDDNYKKFYAALKEVTTFLAKKMAADGEGASKLLEVTVVNAKTKDDARTLAKSVITSNLVKAAVFGNDANWGRIICALGYAGVQFDPYQVDITISSNGQSLKMAENGLDTGYSEEEATKILGGETVCVLCDIKAGKQTATAWGCDLTYDYVKINADYRS